MDTDMRTQGVSRRAFLGGAGVVAASMAAAGLLGGCSSEPKQGETTDGASQPEKKAYDPVEVKEADVVVVGAGASGVAAAVQAAELGAKTIVLEKQSVAGGNGQGTEGMFAAESSLQREKGLPPITFRQVIKSEQEFFNFRIDNLLWRDLVDASGANIDWLIENGVEFSGEVDNYNGMGKIEAFHWFKDAKGTNYINPMVESAQKQGAEVLLSTPAVDLVMDGSTVAGVYAENEGGDIIQINAKAVILATGGYAGNADMMKERGRSLDHTVMIGQPGHDGDGLRMAASAGAHDVSRERAFLCPLGSAGIDFFQPMTNIVHHGGPVLWVNQDGVRYTNEFCGAQVDGCYGNAVHTQKTSWAILASEQVAMLAEGAQYPALADDIEAAVQQNPDDNVFKADTIADLAKAAGLDAPTLEETVKRYNELCETGEDEDFDKDKSMMVPIATGPFYIFRQDFVYATSIGAIDTNRRMEVLTPEGETIPGLYAVGTDGCNLYRETYTISVPASCNANNLNSGRTAARNACEYAGVA